MNKYRQQCREEYIEFMRKVEEAGSVAQLINNRGNGDFPRQLVPLVREIQRDLSELERCIEAYGEAIA